jgi:hypothetical protein
MPEPTSAPPDVTYEGKIYHATGKTGMHIETGTPSAEYRHYPEGGPDTRVWRRSTGEIDRE